MSKHFVPLKLFVFLLLTGLGGAFAQTCTTEIRGEVPDAALSQTATGLDAAEALRRTVDVLEPALPQLYSMPTEFSVMPSEAHYTTARFLRERGLFPSTWTPDGLEPADWEFMLNGLRDWFGLPQVTVAQPPTLETVLDDLNEVVELALPSLETIGLFSPSSDDDSKLAFWGIARRDSIYPRIIVQRPPEADVGRGADAALAALSTCAHTPTRFLSAAEATARTLFLENNRSDMYLVGSAPQPLEGFEQIDKGQELGYLTFTAEATEGVSSYAVVFAGKGLGLNGIMRLLPRVRTNMTPQDLLRFAQGN